MSKQHDYSDEGNTTTEYQATVVDPNIGENSQVQCANCGSWRPNSRLYCPVCGARNVVAHSEFLTEEEVLAKAGMSAAELKASIREPEKETRRRRLWVILGFAVLLAGGLVWAQWSQQQIKQEELSAQQAEQQAAQVRAAQQKAQQALAAEQERVIAAEAALAAASAAAAESAAATLLSDEQATKLGLATPAPKRKLVEPPPPPIVSAPPPAVVVVTPEPPKPEPAALPQPPKVETPAEKLASSYAACKQKGGFFERNACEFDVRKRLCPQLEGKVQECPIQRNDL